MKIEFLGRKQALEMWLYFKVQRLLCVSCVCFSESVQASTCKMTEIFPLAQTGNQHQNFEMADWLKNK